MENYLKKELYELIKTNPEIFNFIQRGSLDGIWYWDLIDTDNEWMSDEFWRLLGHDPSTKKHKVEEWQNLINQEDLQTALINFQKHLIDPNHKYDQLVRYKHIEGRTIWVRCRGMAIRDKNGKPTRMIGAHTDVTELKELQLELEKSNEELRQKNAEMEKLMQSLRENANTDGLTYLYNRHFIKGFFAIEAEKANRNNEPFGVTIIDVNDFKKINDTYGHLFGDEVLIDFSKRIKSLLRKQDVVCRWGGDEFLIVYPSSNTLNLTKIEEKLENAFKDLVVNFNGFEANYTVSFGSSKYIIGEDYTECIERADLNMFKNKQQ